ncbi:MAG: hypothetical protein JJE04_05440 [Acidobacteriia bacterium]|nr:hypothetical protein [Terriglobia bacterium]
MKRLRWCARIRWFGSWVGNLGARTERRALLHAFEDEVDPVGIVLHHPSQMREYVVLLADALLGPFDGWLVIAGVSFHPVPVHFSALTQDGLLDDWNTDDIAEKVDCLLGPRQTTQVPVDDDPVEAMVYKYKQAAKQLCERLHRSSSSDQVLST